MLVLLIYIKLNNVLIHDVEFKKKFMKAIYATNSVAIMNTGNGYT